jgi:hypothetical protein
MEELVSREN